MTDVATYSSPFQLSAAGSSGGVSEQTGSAIQWIRQSDGAQVAYIQAFESAPGSSIFDDQTFPNNGPSPTATRRLIVWDRLGDPNILTLDSGDVSTTVGTLKADLGTAHANLFDGNGASDFLQLATHQKLAIQIGQSNVTFTASAISSVRTINTVTGRPPQAIFTQIAQSASGVFLNVTGTGATSFTVQALATSSLSVTLNFYYLAFQ